MHLCSVVAANSSIQSPKPECYKWKHDSSSANMRAGLGPTFLSKISRPCQKQSEKVLKRELLVACSWWPWWVVVDCVGTFKPSFVEWSEETLLLLFFFTKNKIRCVMPDSSWLCLRLIPVFLSFNLQYAGKCSHHAPLQNIYRRQKYELPLRGHEIMSEIDGCIG